MKIARNAKDAGEVYRDVLYVAAASFFFATGISVIQGYPLSHLTATRSPVQIRILIFLSD